MSHVRVLEPFAIGTYTGPSGDKRKCMVRGVWEKGLTRKAELVDQDNGEAFFIAETPGSPHNDGGWKFE